MNSFFSSLRFLSPCKFVQRSSLCTLNSSHPKFPSCNEFAYNLHPTDEQKLEEINGLHDVYHHTQSQILELLKSKLATSGLDETQIKNILSGIPVKKYDRLGCQVDLIKEHLDGDQVFADCGKLKKYLQRNLLGLTQLVGSYHELGIPFELRYLSKNLPWSWTVTVKKLRQQRIFAPDKDIPRDVFTCLQAPASVMEELPLHYEDKTMQELSLELKRIFLGWQLGAGSEELVKHKCFKHRSFTMMLRVLRLMRERFLMDDVKIRAYSRLITGCPHMYEEYANHKGRILDVDVDTMVFQAPILLLVPLHRALRNDQLLTYIHGNCTVKLVSAAVLYIPTEKLLSHIEFYLKKTSLTDVRLMPGNLHLFRTFEKRRKQLLVYEKERGAASCLPEYLQGRKKWTTAHTGKGRHIIDLVKQFLSLHLGLEKNLATTVWRETRLLDIPSLMTLKQNYVFLLDKGFHSKVIEKAPHILFYPYQLVKMGEEELLNTKYGPLYYETKDFDKLLQLLHCKVYRMCVVYAKVFP